MQVRIQRLRSHGQVFQDTGVPVLDNHILDPQVECTSRQLTLERIEWQAAFCIEYLLFVNGNWTKMPNHNLYLDHVKQPFVYGVVSGTNWSAFSTHQRIHGMVKKMKFKNQMIESKNKKEWETSV